MATTHANSPCCGVSVRRFGERRRQCVRCRSTWRIRKKKRGRKPRRPQPALIPAYLERRMSTVRQRAAAVGVGKSSVQRRLAASLAAYLREHAGHWIARLPSRGKLLLIADGIWYRVNGAKYTIHILLLRPRQGTVAVIVPPVVIAGHEDTAGWRAAFETIPPSIQARIGALVCDGGYGVVNLAYRADWLLQRCQFHLLSAVQNYLTTGPRANRPRLARTVMRLVQRVLTDPSEVRAAAALRSLARVSAASRSRGLRRVVSGLRRHVREYRTYLDHPAWFLPTTSNAAESCIQLVRDLLYRCRGFRTRERLAQWLTALAEHQQTIRCNGKYQPN